MHKQDCAVIGPILIDMCRELFTHEGTRFEEEAEPGMRDERDSLAVSLGLGGAVVRGALVMVARQAFFRALYPVELGQPSESDIGDWAGETANQLLGRIKNRLGPYGIDFNLSTPTVLYGDRLELRGSTPPMAIRRYLRIGDERVEVHFEMEREDERPLLGGGAPASASNEGDTVLF